jgi:hypothetical protein
MRFGEPHRYPERGSHTDGASRGNKERVIVYRSNFILSVCLLLLLDTLLLRPSLHCHTSPHFTTLHPTKLHYIHRHFTYSHLHFTTLSCIPVSNKSGQVQLCLVFANKELIFFVLSLARAVYKFVFRLVVQWTYRMYWVRGHAGVRGNEIADELARGGSLLKFAGPQPALGVSRQDIRRRIRRWLVDQHWVCW